MPADPTLTPSARRRLREKAQVRDRILDAAREIFVTEGYEAVTMRRVADAIEYTPPVIYQHFADKATLIREMCLQDFRTFSRGFQVLAGVADPIDRIKAMGLAYVEFGLTHPHHYSVMFMTRIPEEAAVNPGDNPDKGRPDADAYAFLRTSVDEAWAAGRFNPELEDPAVIAQVLWLSLHGIVSLHISWRHAKWEEYREPRVTARLAVEALMTGVTCRADAQP
jgi:AcrR family transcriptional regulator